MIISLQEHLSSLVESNPPGNTADAEVSDVKPASTSSPGVFNFDRKLAENALQMHGHDGIFQPLRAYIEKPLNDTVPDTIDKGNLNDKRPKIEAGRPPMWYVPLPLRENTPDDVSLRDSICTIFFVLSYHLTLSLLSFEYLNTDISLDRAMICLPNFL